MIDTPSIATFAAFVQLKDYRPPTKKEYVRYVRRLGDHYQCDPATLAEDQIRAYYLELRQVRRAAAGFNKLLQATRDGRSSSASRFTLIDPACLSSER